MRTWVCGCECGVVGGWGRVGRGRPICRRIEGCRTSDPSLQTPPYADDKRSGRGVFTIAETGDKYDGEWKNGKVGGGGEALGPC